MSTDVEDVTDLSPDESGRLDELERTIEHGLATFVEVGTALFEIRERRLYRATHPTFERYLAERWQMARRTGYAYIDAARVAANVPTSAQLNLSQAVELAQLEPDEQREVAAEVADLTVAETRALVRRRRAGDAASPAPARDARPAAAAVVAQEHPLGLLGDALRLLWQLDETTTRADRGDMFATLSEGDRERLGVQLGFAIGLLSELRVVVEPPPEETARRSLVQDLRLGFRRARRSD